MIFSQEKKLSLAGWRAGFPNFRRQVLAQALEALFNGAALRVHGFAQQVNALFAQVELESFGRRANLIEDLVGEQIARGQV